MEYVEFTGKHSPRADQIARILKRSRELSVQIQRGEAGIIFERIAIGMPWRIGIAPGGGHTIANPRRAVELANAVPPIKLKVKPTAGDSDLPPRRIWHAI